MTPAPPATAPAAATSRLEPAQPIAPASDGLALPRAPARRRRSVTIVLIVILNFVLFRMMPGSPERILLGRIPNVTPEVIQPTRERWGLDKPLVPGPVRRVHDVDRPGRPRVLVRWARPHRDRGPEPAPVADAPAVRARRAHRDHRRARARRVLGLETRRRRRLHRQRRVADPVLDAVLPARHGPADRCSRPASAGSRRSACETPGGQYRDISITGSPTSGRTSCCPSRPWRSGSSASTPS